MATNYPSSLDVLINPNPNDTLNSSEVPHHLQHANANDAIEAIQTVLGTNPAGSHLTVKDRIIALENATSGQSSLNGLTDVTITTIATGDVLRYNGTEWINTPEKTLTDGGNF